LIFTYRYGCDTINLKNNLWSTEMGERGGDWWASVALVSATLWVAIITIAIVGSETFGWPVVAAVFMTIGLWAGKIVWQEVLVNELGELK
jgi:hypothetical protein